MRNTGDIFLRTYSIDTSMYREILHRITDKNVSYRLDIRSQVQVRNQVRKVWVRAVHANFQ